MSLTRLFFTSRDLDDLERLEADLEAAGIASPQIHVLTLDDGGADQREHLHSVSSLMKRDIVRSGITGAAVGVIAASIVLILPKVMGWTDSAAGWLPWIFLAVIAFGICTWEGGLWGIQTPNAHFRKFEARLRSGEHLFFVDIDPQHRRTLDEAVSRHGKVQRIGEGHAAPSWFVFGQQRFKKIFVDTLP